MPLQPERKNRQTREQPHANDDFSIVVALPQ
jgi:hypothetical protein